MNRAMLAPLRALLLAFALLLAASAAMAGPPYMTDDPEPTDTGHWEVYAPIVEGEGRGQAWGGSAGVEINYGAAKNLQLTFGLPVAFEHDGKGMHWGAGDIAVSAKYRLYHSEKTGFSIAIFPGMTIPTASNHLGVGKITALLPIWAQKDIGQWSVFGGGGYAINPGEGKRDYWTGGIAVSRQVSEKLQLGAEVKRSGADSEGGNGSTSLGFAAIYRLKGPLRLLGSGCPTFEDHVGAAGFHFFTAIGLNF